MINTLEESEHYDEITKSQSEATNTVISLTNNLRNTLNLYDKIRFLTFYSIGHSLVTIIAIIIFLLIK